MAEAALLRQGACETPRHRTAWIEAGPTEGPLMIFIHGWPELGLLWRRQIEHFAARGWRCVAPDMRGYGGSSVPTDIASYAVQELVADMVELHAALGGAPAVWVGHDWGAPICWGVASHHPEICHAVAGLSVPYLARGFALPNLVALVDRELYPEAVHPWGQWEYWIYYREHFHKAARVFESDVAGVFSLLYRRASAEAVGQPAFTAGMLARGGWFGDAPLPPPDPSATLLTADEFDALVQAFTRTGFSGPDAWYMHDDAHVTFAKQAKDFGRLSMPVLFLHGDWDTVCQTTRGRLAEPMREDCSDLTEVTIAAGHSLMLEQAVAVNEALQGWLTKKGLL